MDKYLLGLTIKKLISRFDDSCLDVEYLKDVADGVELDTLPVATAIELLRGYVRGACQFSPKLDYYDFCEFDEELLSCR